MCAMTRRLMRINDADIDLPTLKFKDFDTQPLTTSIPALQNCPLVHDCVHKVMLADMFMSKLNLLLITGRIFRHSYILQRFESSPTEWSMFYAPKRKGDLDLAEGERLHGELDKWSTTLNSYCQVGYLDDDVQDSAPTSSGTVLLVHRAAIKLLHLMAEEVLLRPLTCLAGIQQRPPHPQQSTEDSSTIKARTHISRVASEMLEIFRDFRQKNLLGYLPPLSVGSILTVLISFMVEIKLAEKCPTDCSRHINQYHDCLLSLRELREVWPIAEGTGSFLNQMATNNQIWFARCLKMLAKPTIVSNSTATSTNVHQCFLNNQEKQPTNHSSRVREANEADIFKGQSTPALPHFDYNDDQDCGHTNHNDSQMSSYLASMYPFPLTATDFEIFDPSTYRDIFIDQGLDAFEVSEPLVDPIVGYPSSLQADREERIDNSATVVPTAWREDI